MKKAILLVIILHIFAFSSTLFAQGTSCNVAEPFCTGVTYGFPMNTNTSAESGPDYGCLYTQPNPVWYFLLIDQPGDITIHMESPTGNDIDFAAWGPFTSPTGPCTAQLTAACSSCPNNTSDPSFYPSGNMVDCSFDAAAYEDVHLSNTLTGQYYLLCITNYENTSGNIVFSQSNIGASGAGSTDCSIVTPCDISSATASPGNCDPLTNQYTVSGNIIFTDAPTTGTLTATYDGTAIQFTTSAPFSSPISYSIPGLTSDGAQHTITIQFSDDQFCNFTVDYTSPAPCNSCSTDAGEDQLVCGLSTSFTASAAATDNNLNWSTTGTGVTIYQPSSPTSQVDVTTPGTYTFTWTITNQSGLTCSDNVTIQFVDPTSTFTATGINCFGDASTVTYTGNAGITATYNWDFGTTATASPGTGQGPHTVTWTNTGISTISLTVTEDGCTSTTTTQNILQYPDLTLTVDVTNPGCSSGTGQATPIPSGGATPYGSYQWSNTTGPPFSPGNYSVTLTDALGCTESASFTVTAPNNISIVSNHTDLVCNSDNSGTAEVTVSGGTSPYTYNWPGGQTTPSVTGLAAGTYIVTITDANSCSTTTSITINEPTPVTANITSSANATCSGACNGQATVAGGGGTPGYSYAWPNGQTSATATSLCAGTYQPTVIDSQGCTATTSVTITEPTNFIAQITSSTNISCNGQCTGSATVGITGGTAPYTYNWPNGTNTPTVNGLCAGSYEVTVTDVNGCTASATAIITEPTLLSLAVTNAVAVRCYGDCNGIGSVSPSGGTSPYSYNWSYSGHTGIIDSTLCAGTHYITVTDANGCRANTSLTISQPTQMTITGITPTPATCNGTSDGEVDISILGGIGSYSFALESHVDTIGHFENLPAGTYGITVTDFYGCTASSSVTVDQPTPVQITTTVDQHLCNGQTAYLSINATGGSSPYTFYWNGIVGTSALSVTPTSNTSYQVYVADVNGCTSSTNTINIYVSQPVTLTLHASPEQICPGETVQITPEITGGGGDPYTYYVENGLVIVPPYTINPTTSGYEILHVIDACGSHDVDSIWIDVLPLPQISITADIDKGCQPLTVNFNQGETLPGEAYEWNFGDQSNNELSFDRNPTHIFEEDGIFDVSLTVTSADGCVNTLTINDMITVYPLPDARFITTPSIVSIIKPEVIFTNLSSLASSYIWAFGDGDSSNAVHPVHIYPAMGVYEIILIATTNHGCKDTAISYITVRDEYTFYAPSAFSPDYDLLNDVFTVYGNGISPNDFHMYIYDRWGEIIYETDKYNPIYPEEYGWDGRVKEGDPAAIGTYTWLVFYYDGEKVLHKKAGAVNLIR